jgi:hypothetical protein
VTHVTIYNIYFLLSVICHINKLYTKDGYSCSHDTPIVAADVRNAYLQAPTSEKRYIICRPEFGLEHAGKKAVITQALMEGSLQVETAGTI